MEALRLQEAQPHNDNVIVHTLTMPKRKRGTTTRMVYSDRWKTGDDEVDYPPMNWKQSYPLELTQIGRIAMANNQPGEDFKEDLWLLYGDPHDRFISVEKKKVYFYKALKTSLDKYRKALA